MSDYFSESGPGPDKAAAPAPPAEGQEKEPAEGSTALLPKSIFGGGDLSPGATITLKVMAVHEDEVEVGPAETKTKEPTADEEIDQMAGGKE